MIDLLSPSAEPVVVSAVDFDGFAAWLGQIGRRPPTIEIYVSLLKRFDAFRRSANLTPGRAFVTWKVSRETRRLAGFALRRHAAYCAEIGCSEETIFRPSQLPPPSEPRPDPLPRGEILRILAAARKVLPAETARTLRAWVLLLVCTGMRRAEAAGLVWSDVDWDGLAIRVLGKGGRERVLPLSSRMISALARLRRERPGSPWIGSRNGNVLGPKLFNYAFRRAAVAAGLPEAHPHRIRHLALTRFALRCNGNVHVFRAASGHSDLESSLYYVRVGDAQVRAMMHGDDRGAARPVSSSRTAMVADAACRVR